MPYIIKPVFRKPRYQNALRAMAVLLCGCASQTPAPYSMAADDSRAALACMLPTQCVNSFEGNSPGPMRFSGTATQALALLQATLAEFPEAKLLKAEGMTLEVVFTTPLGFRDLVDFRIDAQAQRIDYRSRSSFGLFDFGKNRSRMTAFLDRFERLAKR